MGDKDEMIDKAARIAEIDRRIAVTRDNIRQLIAQSAALTGIAAEEAAADRMAAQERALADLIQAREALAGRPELGKS